MRVLEFYRMRIRGLSLMSAISRNQFATVIIFALTMTMSPVGAQLSQPALRPPVDTNVSTTNQVSHADTTRSIDTELGVRSSGKIAQAGATTAGVTTSTTTTTTTTSTSPQVIRVSRRQSTTDVRSDRRTAVQMAKYHWLDKVAESDPGIVAAITTHYTAALELAKHPRLGEIAEADHYLCRRLTKWKTVARRLAKNGEADKVVALDPEGMYRAIRRDKATARRLVKNPMFDQMVYDNPDLGKLVAAYM